MTPPTTLRWLLPALSLIAGTSSTLAQSPADVAGMASLPRSELEPVLRGFDVDRGALLRLYPVSASPQRAARMKAYYESTLSGLEAMDYEKLTLEGKVDWTLLRNLARRELHQLEVDARTFDLAKGLAPFADGIFEFGEWRRTFATVEPRKAADALNDLRTSIEAAQRSLDKTIAERKAEPTAAEKSAARRSYLLLTRLRTTLGEWHRFRDGYDPLFSWWTNEPFKAADAALDAYVRTVKERMMGVTAENPNAIIGIPIGREAMEAELKFEMIPYTPDELLAIGEREFAWCEAEMRKASAEMGFGDDWHKALEAVKNDHVAPGEQPALIRSLADDAVAFLKKRELITVPPMAEETWRMEMMSADQQLVSPFFLGGETIMVAFPVDSMGHEQKLMSLRGNNRHFAHATVFHELIPGHHLQQFMNSRTMVHRTMFDNPFWTEGWSLYWEMLMWDQQYHATPQDRIGALFWRSHRCARIVFSIKFHLGEMTPQQCVDFLVDRVGHERANAEGEVRRSLSGDYGPLYQLAYMTGGLQLRALHHDLVDSGTMTNRQFHDQVMREGPMPIEMVRALLTGKAPARDFVTSWRFDGDKTPTAPGK